MRKKKWSFLDAGLKVTGRLTDLNVTILSYSKVCLLEQKVSDCCIA